MKKSWADLEAIRVKLGTISRAELARRAGISESSFTKGLSGNRSPQRDVRKKVELVLEAETRMVEAGLR